MKVWVWLLNAVRSPVETIMFLISIALFAVAFYYSSPWYNSEYSTALSNSFTELERPIVSLILIIVSVIGIFAFFVRENKDKWLKAATFNLFTTWLFLCILRWVSVGFIPFTWVPILALSLISGLLRLYVGVHK